MDTYRDVASLWDFSQPTSFPRIPDNDFLAAIPRYPDNINPQSITRYSIPSSEDNSPSPDSTAAGADDSYDPALKRKASDDGLEDAGPSQKTLHTAPSNKKSSNHSGAVISRRKASGTAQMSAKDESRLMKRKEQNRAAQRAFRERKEKHVKDLEDKVAALETKNEQALSENENLRDLLSRLQSENGMLKQQQQPPFTFSMPKNGSLDLQAGMDGSFVDSPMFASPSRPPASALTSPTSSSTSPPKYTNPLDWSSLTSFDPSMLNVLDEAPQTTATDGAMSMDFGFGTSSDTLAGFPFTTIASNPAFFTSTYDAVTPPHPTATPSNGNQYNFDFGSLTPWPTSNQNIQDPSFSDLFPAYLPSGDYGTILAQTSESASLPRHLDSSSNSSVSSASSPSELLRTPMSDADTGHKEGHKGDCPKTRDAYQKAIEESGPSPFAPPTPPNPSSLPTMLKKTLDTNSSPMIGCSGTKFPKTQQSDKNVELLTAWRTITSNPKFKADELGRRHE
ncbi:hypothetical protein APHAL10511_006569 [Amanita phalloides]|nr:hypothetical protein APHAL10511_006569 [Amanita phalloides]